MERERVGNKQMPSFFTKKEDQKWCAMPNSLRVTNTKKYGLNATGPVFCFRN